jgi:hypothetical protein
MIQRLVLASVGLAATCQAMAHAWAGSWPWAAASLGLGAAWLVAEVRGWHLAAPLGFTASGALAGFSLWLSWDPGVALLALVAIVAALCAWDLDGLARRLDRFGYEGDRSRLERQHLRRLLAVASLGLALGSLALGIKIRLSFLPALLLTLVAVLGLSWAMFLLRSASE